MNFLDRRALALACAGLFSMPAAMAAGFLPGNLIVSRTVYSGDANTVVVGQTLPGGGAAIANGLFPNVFKNESVDASFGVTSAIFIDQRTTSGSLVSTLAIDPAQAVSSFASKSELALNISTDGTAFTFMGYQSAVNALDVSNSNTAAVFDNTNPVASTAARAVVQVSLATGAVQSTAVNAYSGNNGRAAVLSGGNYYMVGNAGNGSATGNLLSQLSDNTGVQSIAANSTTGATAAVGVVKGSFGAASGYQRGFALQDVKDPASPTGANYAGDKTGKDDNFRGLTVFNGTMYVTKGSGSNGVNTVYQVGTSGALNGGGSLSNANITILPGFNTLSEKVAEATATLTATPHPFGLWFANATTLFVADEGDGVRVGVAGKNTSFAGLQEWTLSGGLWSKVATFQQGLLDQAAYTLTDPSTGATYWDVKTDGLRNLTGKVNADGSFTLYATTSTISSELTHDLGADPNEIVSITVGANSTSTNTAFTVLQTAAFGERFGGVALAPVPEPASYALLLAGLTMIGAAIRRRRD